MLTSVSRLRIYEARTAYESSSRGRLADKLFLEKISYTGTKASIAGLAKLMTMEKYMKWTHEAKCTASSALARVVNPPQKIETYRLTRALGPLARRYK